MANVLAVVAHPDDEVLGCGGTLWKHHEAGDTVRMMLLAERGLLDQTLKAWNGEITYESPLPEIPDQRFDSWDLLDIVQRIEEHYYDPDVVYTHWPHDLNLDHAITARAVLTVFRPKPGTKPRRILAFETISSTEWSHGYETFSPNYYVPLTIELVTKKVESMRYYESEIKEFPHPRSSMGIWSKARVRGGECGYPYAEAFHLVRCVEG